MKIKKQPDSLSMQGLFFFVTLLLLPTALQAESYVCIAEQLAGFVYNPDKQSWRGGGSPTDATFIVRQQGEDGARNIGANWIVSERGKDFGMACPEDFDKAGFLRCQGLGGDFLMNIKTMRFRFLQDKGYVIEQYTKATPEGKDSPMMKIGQCQVN